MSRRVILGLLLLGTLGTTGVLLWREWRQRTEGVSAGAIVAMKAEREALRQRLAALLARDARLAGAPAGDVRIGVPVSFAQRLVRELATGFLDQVKVRLGGLKVETSGEVNVKTFLGSMKAGIWKLRLDIDRVEGLLRPGAPRVGFDGKRVTLALPVRLAEGTGDAVAHFGWDSKGVANAVCRDFEVEQALSGSVMPASYTLAGAFALATEGEGILATPHFGEVVLKLKVEPSEKTWQGVRERLAEQDSFWKCGVALKPEQIEQKLREVVGKGFDVKLPSKLFKPIRLPAGLQQDLPPVEGRTFRLAVKPADLKVTDGFLWYAADVEVVEVRASPAPKDPRAAGR